MFGSSLNGAMVSRLMYLPEGKKKGRKGMLPVSVFPSPRLPSQMFPQHRVDLRLIPRTLPLKLVHQIRIQPQRQLLFDRFVKHAAFCTFPIPLFRHVGEVDIRIGGGAERHWRK
jgi:hypothetical protein